MSTTPCFIRISDETDSDCGRLFRIFQAVERTAIPARRPEFDTSKHCPVPGKSDATHHQNSDGVSSHLIRVLFECMGFNENRLFTWHLDHKLIQSQVFSHYVPGMFPETLGLADMRRRAFEQDLPLATAISMAFPSGYFIKRAYTAGSWEGARADNFSEFFSSDDREASVATYNGDPLCEEWIVQRRIPIRNEVRIHTLEDMVLPGLSNYRHQGEGVVRDFDRVNSYVANILRRLPPGLVGQTLYAWDIAEDDDGLFKVIEINLTGLHASFRPGFQCSGFFQELPDGPRLLSILLNHAQHFYNVFLDFPHDSIGYDPDYFSWYAAIKGHMNVGIGPPALGETWA